MALAMRNVLFHHGTQKLFGQYGIPPMFAPAGGAMPVLVAAVGQWCIPSQIYQPVVGLVAVVVATLHSVRTRTDKGFENQAVYAAKPVREMHAEVPAAAIDRLQDFARPCGDDPAEVADSVITTGTGNLTPLLSAIHLPTRGIRRRR